jgi:methionine-R-sulfoxide reductase
MELSSMISRHYAKALLAALGIYTLTAAIAATHGQPMSKPQAKEKSNMNAKASQQASTYSCTCAARTETDWKKILTPKQYHITREQGTERAFTGKYWMNHEAGIYRCVCCGAPLFSSDAKFESGTGWPSFYEPYDKKNVATKSDDSYFMHRTEVVCEAAVPISATYLMMAHILLVCGIASIRQH